MKTIFIIFLAFCMCTGMMFAGCGEKERMAELKMQVLEKDTIWTGTVVLDGDIYVPPGVTLTIKPGTVIKFKKIDAHSGQNMFGTQSPYFPEAELIVRGRIVARGSAKENIVFTSFEIGAQPKDWGAINLLGSNNNLIEHCKIMFARNGVQSYGAEAQVCNSEFVENGEGISIKNEEEDHMLPWYGKVSDIEISHSRFYNNDSGISVRNSKAGISHNLIENNKYAGIVFRGRAGALVTYNEIIGNKEGICLYQGGKVRIEHNNIYDNTDYNIVAAEAQSFDIEAPKNWFGTIDTEKIDKSIFDRQDKHDLEKVIYKPFLLKRINWEE